MAWKPPDATFEQTILRIITRAREEAVVGFDRQMDTIRREQAARGVIGGAVIKRGEDAAEQANRKVAGAPDAGHP